ncbi:MAG: TonB family protein [Fibromonadaceae bacterium]|jgi:TonB family protein|nr:TonB family protein [Fibromonadaceae bacterium]
MKTNRFLSLAIIFAVLMSVNSVNAQITATLAACSAGELFSCLVIVKKTYDFLKKKEDEAAVKDMGTTFNEWGKKQMNYMKTNGQIGDCKDIKFLPPKASYNQPTNSFKNGDFSYECGKRPGKGGDSTAYIKAKTVRKIGDCSAENSFVAKINYVDGYITFAVEPLSKACLFFEEPSLTNRQKEDRAKEVKQWKASAEASKKPQTRVQTAGGFNAGYAEGGSGGLNGMLGGLMGGSHVRHSIHEFSGWRSDAEIMAVVNQRVNDLKSIYDRYLKNKPGFGGRITLNLTIAPSGDITAIGIVSSTTGYSEFDKAIKEQVSKWKWNSIKNGNTTAKISFDLIH